MSTAGTRVLIIDDEERFAELYERDLAADGCVPMVVDSVQSLSTQVLGFAPDVVVVSVFGLGIGKLEAARALRRLCPDCPIIVTSPVTSLSAAIRSYALGARDLVSKSGDTYELVQAVHLSAGAGRDSPALM